jgi:kumamolisin
LASLAAVAFPQAAAAEVKDSGLGEKQLSALIELHHPRGLNQFVRAVSDPASPRYRHYSTVERLVARFGAKPKTTKRALAWLGARGVEGTVTASGTFVIASLSARQAARLLPPGKGAATSGGALTAARPVPAGLRDAVGAITLLPAGTKVERLVSAGEAGFDPNEIEEAANGVGSGPYRSVRRHSGTAKGCADSSTGGQLPGPDYAPFTPNQYLTAYGHADLHKQGLQGQGQTVALVEVGGFKKSDIVAFAKCFGQDRIPPIVATPVAPAKKLLPPEDEVTLDLEMLVMGAPKLDRILVYEGGEELDEMVLTAGTALGNPGHRPDVISISLGYCEPKLKGSLAARDAIDDIFGVAAGAGISVLVSSGDSGSAGCRVVDLLTGEKTALPILTVSLPASSSYVTAVGGTNLELTAKNEIKREIVWNDFTVPWAGSGGGSIISPRTPWWQSRVTRYGPGRKVPDIAALADIVPGYAFFCTAAACKPEAHPVYGWGSVGGTSAAAPLTAAGIALANQYAAKQGQPALGFLNPLIYQLGAKKQSRASVFTDVTVGNNDIGRALPPQAEGGIPLGCCQAKPGYDWASGWGSLKLPRFAQAAAASAR